MAISSDRGGLTMGSNAVADEWTMLCNVANRKMTCSKVPAGMVRVRMASKSSSDPASHCKLQPDSSSTLARSDS